MERLKNFSIVILLALLTAGGVQAQVGSGSTKHYEKNGLAFDYPNDWSLTESRWTAVQTVTVAPEGRATKIAVTLHPRAPLCDFQEQDKRIVDDLSKQVAAEIQAGVDSGTSVTTQVGTSKVEGTQLRGVMNRRPVIGDIYSVRLNGQFVSLVYIRRIDDQRANSAWDTFRTTLKTQPGVTTVLVGTEASSGSGTPPITGGVLNGRAIRLPHPRYPAIARQAHAAGTVTVQVTIDESGAVVAAHVVDGHPLLAAVSLAAAKDAQFSPTKLCGEPVRVTG
ncbi:MAG: TonB family protein, partial [Pyrinomonadaceae bacterium]